jgi:hypothetical protein
MSMDGKNYFQNENNNSNIDNYSNYNSLLQKQSLEKKYFSSSSERDDDFSPTKLFQKAQQRISDRQINEVSFIVFIYTHFIIIIIFIMHLIFINKYLLYKLLIYIPYSK